MTMTRRTIEFAAGGLAFAGRRAARNAIVVLALCAAAAPASARTILLTADDCDMMAVLCAKVPRLSWAVYQANPRAWTTDLSLHIFSDMSLLLRFPLERIPEGQRITRAELSVAPSYVAGKPELHVRRLLAEWGTGVCHQYRMAYPDKVPWERPGARGAGADCTAKDSGVFRMEKVGEHTIDVTADVELWYTGAAPNRGWVLCFDNPGQVAYLPTPYSPRLHSGKAWKLQITFEPK